MMTHQVIILGGGASGLFCAANLAERGLSVLLLEGQGRLGRKLLLSGGGKCNITNLQLSPVNYLSENPEFCAPALDAFGPEQMLGFLREQKIALEEREYSQIFCRRGAQELRDALLRLCGQASSTSFNSLTKAATGPKTATEILLNQKNIRVSALREAGAPELFKVACEGGVFSAPNLVVATGSGAWPKSGATDFGQKLALSFGHSLVPARPALTPLAMPKTWPLHGLSGIDLPVRLGVRASAPVTAPLTTPFTAMTPVFERPLLFTHNGISGPACLQISGYLQAGETLWIDFLPQTSCEELFNQAGSGKVLLGNLLARYLPERLVAALVPQNLRQRKTAELSRAGREEVSAAVHRHEVVPLRPSFERAEAARGGVCTLEVCPRTMESLKQKGLFFCGEVLDVCGQLGGYNLHWAFASAYACACSCATPAPAIVFK